MNPGTVKTWSFLRLKSIGAQVIRKATKDMINQYNVTDIEVLQQTTDYSMW